MSSNTFSAGSKKNTNRCKDRAVKNRRPLFSGTLSYSRNLARIWLSSTRMCSRAWSLIWISRTPDWSSESWTWFAWWALKMETTRRKLCLSWSIDSILLGPSQSLMTRSSKLSKNFATAFHLSKSSWSSPQSSKITGTWSFNRSSLRDSHWWSLRVPSTKPCAGSLWAKSNLNSLPAKKSYFSRCSKHGLLIR